MANAVMSQRTFLGHPVGLYILFFTEMWERFSYYGMRALLILYMVNYFKWSQQEASNYYKVYTSLVYITPIIGGYLADRLLGNKWAVIIGASLMAVGHFLMAFEEFPIFMAALIFLIIGNGFFKPNMSTQVGRLYPTNDGRRDGAYTIFYMGINLGAFLSPLACGWLAENTVGGFHSGFTLAGIGMVLGLAIYLLGQPLIREIPPDAPAPPAEGTEGAASAQPPPSPPYELDPSLQEAIQPAPAAAVAPPITALTEAEASAAPSIFGGLSGVLPLFLMALGALVFAAAPLSWFLDFSTGFNAFMLGMAGFCLVLIGYIAGQVQGGVRDRVLAILVLGIFVMFFWAAFEQAGNVLNIWADQQTSRYLTQQAPPPQVIPEVIEDQKKEDSGQAATQPQTGPLQRFGDLFTNMITLKPRPAGVPEAGWAESFNPVPTAWFQSINALAIFLIAPLFAWMWVALDRRGWQPSIPLKMTLGLLFMSAAMAVMMAAGKQEHQHTSLVLKTSLPAGVEVSAEDKLGSKDAKGHFEPFHAGRLGLNAQKGSLELDGVLEENERDKIILRTAPPGFVKKIDELKEASQKIDGNEVKSAEVVLDEVPPGFDMKYAGLKKSAVDYRPEDRKIVAYKEIAEKEYKGLLVAAGEPRFRNTIHELFVESTRWRVSPWWLFWSYILATLGELCLSPVGLSMVSKLAPAKFATMLMGVWMLTSAFGNFAAGALGEIWGTIPPIQFFLLSTVVVGGAAIVLFMIVTLVVRMMHGVK
jgi:POT family proton-dependent oligopeptide transporter